jgi:hypothetical protein
MNAITRKLSIFVLIAAAATTTALTIGATTTFAASNTHTHDIQLMGKDDSWASSFTHIPVNWTGDVGSGGFNSEQYGWSHPHHHHSSTNMIADLNGDNSNSTAGTGDRGDFSSAQYGSSGSHSHHHKDSTTPNSSWMWPTHRSTSPDDVYVS